MIRINKILLHNNNAQAIIEYSIFIVLMMLAFVVISGRLQRALQGRERSSVDSLAGQFSDGHTNTSRVDIVEANTTEQFDGSLTTRRTNQTYRTIERQSIDSFNAELQGEL